MRILVGCEFSGVIRQAFREKGHDAYSCDLLPSDDNSPYHLQCDVLNILNNNWDLAIFHPPCTYLTVSGIHWNNRTRGWDKTEEALEFVQKLLDAPINKIALENPISIISSRIRKPDQILQPWQFGHDASKTTCLWLKNLPKLQHDKIIPPKNYFLGQNAVTVKKIKGYSFGTNIIPAPKPVWGNQTASGQNKLGPSENRWKLRSKTYLNIAKQMADQWTQ